MVKYFIDGVNHDFAKLSDVEIQRLLDKHAREKTGMSVIYCGCRPTEKLVLHTFNRSGEFFLRRAGGTGEKHNIGCRHRSLSPESVALLGYAPGTISNSEDDTLIIKLSVPLAHAQQVTQLKRTPGTIRSRNGQSATRSLASRVTELGALRLLWSRAGLTTHDPSANDGDGDPWPALRCAAKTIKPARLHMPYGISEILLLPLASDKDEQGKRNWAKLKEAYGRRYVMYLEILDGAEYTAMLDHLADGINYAFSQNAVGEVHAHRFKVKVGVYQEDAQLLYGNLTNQFPCLRQMAADGAKVVVFGRAEVFESSGKTYYAKVRSMVAMPVTAQLIPFESSYERQMADYLVSIRRRFEKPFASEASIDDRLAPDFILQDCPTPVVIEVYGMSTQEYLERKAEKQAIYADEYLGDYWEWHANEETLQAALQRQALPAIR